MARSICDTTFHRLPSIVSFIDVEGAAGLGRTREKHDGGTGEGGTFHTKNETVRQCRWKMIAGSSGVEERTGTSDRIKASRVGE